MSDQGLLASNWWSFDDDGGYTVHWDRRSCTHV